MMQTAYLLGAGRAGGRRRAPRWWLWRAAIRPCTPGLPGWIGLAGARKPRKARPNRLHCAPAC